jgi:hypothetical protein
VFEGDSRFLETRYEAASPLFSKEYEEWIAEQYDYIAEHPDESNYADYPQFIVDWTFYPYDDGSAFIKYLYDEGGYDLVNQAFEETPGSSEQILHPEKYLDDELPEDINVIAADDVLGDGWEWLRYDAFGEVKIRNLFLADGYEDAAADAAAGWNGDQYSVYGTEDDTVLIWQTSWDSDDDAEEFASLLADRENKRWDDNAKERRDTWTIKGDDTVVLIHIEDEYVTYVLAPDKSTAQELLDQQLELMVG